MNDLNRFDADARTVPSDGRTNYDSVAISLHWLTALLVLVQFALAETWYWFSRDTRENLQSTHVSFGILLTLVVVVRLIWRSIPSHQRASIESGWMRIASKSVHYLLYILLVAQAGLGWTLGWSGGHPIHFFGLPIPGPLGALSRSFRHNVRELHSAVGWAIIIIALGHALAALYHHYRLHDRVLGRMFPPARKSESAV